MNSQILIREVTFDDAGELLKIRNHFENYKWFFQEIPISPEEHANWLEARLMDSKFFTLVAERDSKVVGTAYLSDLKLTSPKVSISVKHDSKAKGVGAALLNELVFRAKLANLNSIIAEIKSTNIASIEFFSKYGFTLISQDYKKVNISGAEIVVLGLNLCD